MNKTQKIIIAVTCFILGVFLIYGALIGAGNVLPRTGEYPIITTDLAAGGPISFFFKDIKLYLGIISIGAGFFFLMKRVKDE